MSGQFDRYGNNTYYWILTPNDVLNVFNIYNTSDVYRYSPSYAHGIRPSLNLKSNVVITSGDGTKNNPFTLELAS